jgi:putative transcriptional regulator
MKTKHDWSRADAMTEAQIHTAALADPDAQPLTAERLETMSPMPRTRTIRRALGLTQEQFAARYHLSLGSLRDWEQGICQPDQAARAYLRAIAGDPEAVQRALETMPS